MTDPSTTGPHNGPPAKVWELASRSARLQGRRLELLPLRGPHAAFTDVQGRGWGANPTTSPAELADLISSIATCGLLQPVLVEQLPDGARRVVSGHRRLLAMRWGANHLAGNPHFDALPANVVDGPLTDEEIRVWQLIENLARTDLQPGELAAALLYERCAALAGELARHGVAVNDDIRRIDDPVQRWEALDRVRRDRGLHNIGASWPTVIRRLGLQMSPDKAKKLVAAFRALPAEVSADMDAHDVALTSRMEWLRLRRGRQDAADQIWAAVKTRQRPDLLTRACTEAAAHPAASATDAVELAEAVHTRADAARAAAHTPTHDTDATATVDSQLVADARNALQRLLVRLRAGARLDRYDAGSLRLALDELAAAVDRATTAADPHQLQPTG